MGTSTAISRRALLASAGALPLLLSAVAIGQAETLPLVTVTKDPSCGCCEGWADHIRAAGFPVKIVESADVDSLKRRLRVPAQLASCHTAEVEGYVIEGHVPATALRRLLAERPVAMGLALPGMPAGSPGMEVPGVEPERYAVILFGPAGQQTFMQFRGGKEV